MVIYRIVPKLKVGDAGAGHDFYVEFLGLEKAFDLGWIASFRAPDNWGAQVRLVTSAPEDSVMSVNVADVDAAYPCNGSSRFGGATITARLTAVSRQVSVQGAVVVLRPSALTHAGTPTVQPPDAAMTVAGEDATLRRRCKDDLSDVRAVEKLALCGVGVGERASSSDSRTSRSLGKLTMAIVDTVARARRFRRGLLNASITDYEVIGPLLAGMAQDGGRVRGRLAQSRRMVGWISKPTVARPGSCC